MGKTKLSENKIQQIINLRKTGHSINEIQKQVGCGFGTVHRYCKNVSVSNKYKRILKEKQGGSKIISFKNWEDARKKALLYIVNKPNLQERLYLLAGLYWGEGDKRELSLINSDPDLIKIFIYCLQDIGIKTDQLKINLRIYTGINKNEAINFWSKYLNIDIRLIKISEIVEGGDRKKHKYGMCRVRVAKSGLYFKLIMSLIFEIKSKLFNAAVVQRIEQGTPKP